MCRCWSQQLGDIARYGYVKNEQEDVQHMHVMYMLQRSRGCAAYAWDVQHMHVMNMLQGSRRCAAYARDVQHMHGMCSICTGCAAYAIPMRSKSSRQQLRLWLGSLTRQMVQQSWICKQHTAASHL